MLNRKQLVDQQFWLFGRDVSTDKGNRLLQLGGRRIAQWRRGKAAGYLMPMRDDPDAKLVLWGFGALHIVGDVARAYLQRSTGRIRIPNAAQAVVDFEQARSESFFAWRHASDAEADRLDPIARWVIDHERAVVGSYGLAARRREVSEWAALGKRTVAADSIASSWKQLVSGHPATDATLGFERAFTDENSSACFAIDESDSDEDVDRVGSPTAAMAV